MFEIRTYTAAEGKLDALHARFRDHTLIYILAHPNREAAAKNWQAFHDDPEWQKVKAASEEQGALTTKIESVFADPTDYSPMK